MDRLRLQSSRLRLPPKRAPQVGDTVKFLNDDKFAHNIYSETPGFEFNFRQQMPGEKDILVLDKTIVFDVKCAIQPRMIVTISVK